MNNSCGRFQCRAPEFHIHKQGEYKLSPLSENGSLPLKSVKTCEYFQPFEYTSWRKWVCLLLQIK